MESFIQKLIVQRPTQKQKGKDKKKQNRRLVFTSYCIKANRREWQSSRWSYV